MKYIKTISWFLGISMFMFGVLKFVNPFKEWYFVQISESGLGEAAYALGILGEIGGGTLFIGAFLLRSKISSSLFNFSLIMASVILFVMMIGAIYVHMQPEVPADVLPAKIKSPFVPGFFLALSILNISLILKHKHNLTV